MSLEGGFEEVDESFRAAANCFSNSAILANASASSRSSSATRRARRSQFGQVFRRVPMTRQHKPRGQNPPMATPKPVDDPQNPVWKNRSSTKHRRTLNSKHTS